MKLTILPTARATSHYIQTRLDTNQILGKAITIATFFEKAIIIQNKVMIDSDSRVLLLNESIDFEQIKKFGFEKDFISFIKNSEFIFKFFDEIFAENISLDDINSSDIYGEFSDHLEILSIVYKSYKKNLDEHNYYDRATIDKYSINTNFFANYSSIDIHLEGFLTNTELKIVEDVSKVVQLYIHIEYNTFNHKMVSKFVEYGLEIDKYGSYVLDITNNKLHSYTPKNHNTIFDVASFSSTILQCAYVFKKIHDFVQIQNYDPEKIAVILPDETYANILSTFDKYNNLNFAMGKDFVDTKFYKRLEAIFLYIVEYNKENIERIKNLSLDDTIHRLKDNSIDEFDKLIMLIDVIKSDCSDKELELISNTMYKLDKYAHKLKRYTFRELLSFSLILFKELKIDDIGGGKIKVIGVLESRNIEFDAVIILSFNEGIVPKVSTKDIFLNSQIKSFVNLPTKKDREELQKYYYSRLFANSKEVAISYIQNSEYSASRFLKELGLGEANVSDSKYQSIIFNTPNIIKHYNELPTVQNTWVQEELSSTRLTTFLSCKAKFYYNYIQGLKQPTTDTKDKLKIGVLFHNAFDKIIDSTHTNPAKLKQDIKASVLSSLDDSTLKFDVHRWLKHLDNFCDYEIDRYNQGYRIYEKEQSHSIEYDGLKLMGRIDRVDIKDDKLHIIDYKLQENIKIDTKRNYEKTKDFQMEFYYLLIKEKYKKEIQGVYLYDIKHTKLLPEEMLYEKLSMLDDKLQEYKQPTLEIQKCDDKSVCRYCSYATICDRD